MQTNSEMRIRIYTTSFVDKKNVQANPSLLTHYDIKNATNYLNKMFIKQ
jgi:hypothetical protein